MGGVSSQAPKIRAMRGTPPPPKIHQNNLFSRTSTPLSSSLIRLTRFLSENTTESLAEEFDILNLCLSMDEEVDELGDGLEDLEIDVEFVSYAGSCETFRRFKSLGVGTSARVVACFI